MRKIRELLKDEAGLVAIEYAVIGVGIAVALVMVVGLVGDQLVALFNRILAAFMS